MTNIELTITLGLGLLGNALVWTAGLVGVRFPTGLAYLGGLLLAGFVLGVYRLLLSL